MPPNPCENFFLIIYTEESWLGKTVQFQFFIDKITLYEKVIFSCKINYNL